MTVCVYVSMCACLWAVCILLNWWGVHFYFCMLSCSWFFVFALPQMKGGEPCFDLRPGVGKSKKR